MTSAPHTDHDLLLVSSHASGDLTGAELERAEALIASCAECAELATDLRILSAATRAMPAPARRRDFRLTPADAARLRPSGWRGFVAAFAAPRMAFTRPLAASLTTLGLAGLLLASLPTVLPFGGAASNPAPLVGVGSSVGAPAESPKQTTDREVGLGAGSPDDSMIPAAASAGAEQATPAPSVAAQVQTAAPEDGDTSFRAGESRLMSGDQPLSPLVPASLLLLAVGLGLFVLRRAGARLR